MGDARTTIGASEVAAILGYSPWASPFSLWAKLQGLVEDTPTASTVRGQIIEPALRDWYAREHGTHIVHGPAYEETPWTREDVPWQAARPDGWWSDADGAHLIEIKTTRDWYGWDPYPPPHYRVQVLWQQWVAAGFLSMPIVGSVLVAYSPMNEEIRTFDLPYDEQAQRRAANLSAVVTRWWERHMVQGEPVEVDEHAATRDALRQLYARPERVFLEPTPELVTLVDDYRAAKAAADAAKVPFDLARNRLVAAIGNTSGIDGLVTFTAGKARRLILKGETDV